MKISQINLSTNPQSPANTFKGWKTKNIRTSLQTDEGRKLVGECFCDLPKERIKEASTIKIFGIKRRNASKKLFNQILEEAFAVSRHKTDIIQKRDELTEKKQLENINTCFEKRYLRTAFLNEIMAEKFGENNVNISNGILLHGSMIDKSDIVNWLKAQSGMNFKKINCSEISSFNLLQELSNAMKSASELREDTGQRTLIYLKDFDQTSLVGSAAKESDMATFLKITDSCADKSGATLLVTTTKQREDFNTSALLPFYTFSNLQGYINESEIKLLREYDNEINRLNRINAFETFYKKGRYDSNLERYI